MARWWDAGAWEGGGLRREVFFFPARDVMLYGSVYAPAGEKTGTFGVLICNSWGFEGNLASDAIHALSISVAEAGGVAASFHYPGFGDSQGEIEAAAIGEMADAAVAALTAGSERHPDVRWSLAGLMLGASVAALATIRGANPLSLLLVQPALRPGRYFTRLARASRRSLGGATPAPARGFAYGYPLPAAIVDAAKEADSDVDAALAAFDGDGAIVRSERPAVLDGVPPHFEQIVVEGSWRFGSKDHRALTAGATEWVEGRLARRSQEGRPC